MKLVGAAIAVIGGLLFGWHAVKVLVGTDNGPLHAWLSLVGGVLLFAGIWVYTTGRRNARRAAGEPFE